MVRIALERDLQILKNLLLDMAKAVNEMITGSLLSLEKLDPEMAEKIIKFDEQVDYYEHMVTLTALEIIALQQPVAKDLRFIVSAIEISRNLERLADQAVNIAQRVSKLLDYKDIISSNCNRDIIKNMANEALKMLEVAIDAFLTEDINKAKKVIDYDDVVDQFKREYISNMKGCIKNNPNLTEAGIEYIIVVQNLERVADHACNIAENVIFTVQGKMPKLETACFPGIREILSRELPVFNLLLRHARLVIECMGRLPLALEAYIKKDKSRFEEIIKHIVDIEKEADKIKTNIRGHLPKGIILPMEKFELFLYLKEQDAVADYAEAILNWLSFKDISFSEKIALQLEALLNQSLEPLNYLEDMIIMSYDFLINWNEDSRIKAKELIRTIRYKEFLTEELGNQSKKLAFQEIKDPIELFFVLKLIDLICEISHHTENAADLMRTMIAK